MYYDRQGKELTTEEWIKVSSLDPDNTRVARTDLPNKNWVSTVWIGLDHQHGDGPPLIFETMVFSGGGGELDCVRYSTEKQALKGHYKMCAKWCCRG